MSAEHITFAVALWIAVISAWAGLGALKHWLRWPLVVIATVLGLVGTFALLSPDTREALIARIMRREINKVDIVTSSPTPTPKPSPAAPTPPISASPRAPQELPSVTPSPTIEVALQGNTPVPHSRRRSVRAGEGMYYIRYRNDTGQAITINAIGQSGKPEPKTLEASTRMWARWWINPSSIYLEFVASESGAIADHPKWLPPAKFIEEDLTKDHAWLERNDIPFYHFIVTPSGQISLVPGAP